MKLFFNKVILAFLDGNHQPRVPSVGKDLEPMELTYTAGRSKTTEILWKTDWQFFIKSYIYLTYSPAILLLVTYPREMKVYVPTKSQRQMFRTS